MNSENDDRLAAAVLDYLAECPNAMDTATGVTEWWLHREHVRVQVEAVARVLRALVDGGTLEEVGTGDRCMYRLKRQP